MSDSPEPQYKLARQHQEAGQLDEAEDSFRELLRQFPQPIRSRVDIAMILASRGEHPAAIQAFRSLLVQSPGLVGARGNLALLLTVSGDWDEARALVDAVTETGPGSGALHQAAARIKMLDQDFEDAVTEYALAVQFRLQNASLRREYAAALQSAGRLSEPLEQFRMAARTAESNAESWKEFAPALQSKPPLSITREEWVEARDALLRVLPAAHEDAEVHKRLTYCFLGLKQYRAAETHASEAARLDPADPVNLKLLAIARHRQLHFIAGWKTTARYVRLLNAIEAVKSRPPDNSAGDNTHQPPRSQGKDHPHPFHPD
jgi:tetratricopeptide (TPR) repeat protein